MTGELLCLFGCLECDGMFQNDLYSSGDICWALPHILAKVPGNGGYGVCCPSPLSILFPFFKGDEQGEFMRDVETNLSPSLLEKEGNFGLLHCLTCSQK